MDISHNALPGDHPGGVCDWRGIADQGEGEGFGVFVTQ